MLVLCIVLLQTFPRRVVGRLCILHGSGHTKLSALSAQTVQQSARGGRRVGVLGLDVCPQLGLCAVDSVFNGGQRLRTIGVLLDIKKPALCEQRNMGAQKV